MSDVVITAIISGGLTLLGTIITVVQSHRSTISKLEKSSELADEKMKGEINLIKEDIRILSDRVEQHNKVVERTYELEKHASIVDEKLKHIRTE